MNKTYVWDDTNLDSKLVVGTARRDKKEDERYFIGITDIANSSGKKIKIPSPFQGAQQIETHESPL